MAKKDKQKKGKETASVPPAGAVPPMGAGVGYPQGGIPSTGIFPPTQGVSSVGMFPPPQGMNSTGVYTGMSSTTTTTYSTGVAGAGAGIVTPPPVAEKGKKGKKKDKKKKGKDAAPQMQIDRSKLTPEQLAQLQLEEAIKESTDPSSRLKKLKSPLSVGGCLGMLAIFIVATLLIVFIVCWIMVDTFNPLVIAKDMCDKFGITGFFKAIGDWFKGLFGGKKETEEIIKAALSLIIK